MRSGRDELQGRVGIPEVPAATRHLPGRKSTLPVLTSPLIDFTVVFHSGTILLTSVLFHRGAKKDREDVGH